MREIIIISLLTTSILIGSCSSRFIASEISPKSGFEVTIIDPASSIHLIPRGEGNVSYFSDSLTLIANRNITNGLNQFLSGYFRVNNLNFDPETNRQIDIQLYQMMLKIKAQRKINRVPIPPSLDSIMNLYNIDYAVCTVHLGNNRESGSYQKGLIKGAIITFFSLGTYNDIPKRSSSNLNVFILDGINDRITFHDRSNWKNLEPANKNVTDRQIEDIFDKYFKNL